MSSLPNHRKQYESSLPFHLNGREPLYLLEEIPWQVPLPQQLRREGPRPSRERRELRLPLSEFLTISSSSSKHGRELLTVKNNGFQTSILDQRSLVLPCGLQKEMRSPLRDPLKQEESSLLVIFGKRREFLSRELFYLLASLHLDLKKTEESSLLGSMDRAPPAFNQKKGVAPPKLQTKRSDPPSTFNMKANSATSCSKSTRKLPQNIGGKRRGPITSW